MKYIKNLEDQTQSVLAEDVAKDAAEISGLDADAVSDAVAGLNFASYLELGNAIANQDGELVRELLDVSDVVPNAVDEPIADDEIDLEEGGYEHTETLICERCRGDGYDAWGDTCEKCGGKGRLSLDGEYLDEGTVEEEKLLDKPTPSLKDLAKKHDKSLSDMGIQLAKGIKAEKEHTTDMLVAKEIALDHLNELPDYYDRLEKMEEAKRTDPWTPDTPIPDKFYKNDKLVKNKAYKDWLQAEKDKLKEADNPYAPPAASPAPTAATPPSAGSSIDALAQPADTATDVDDQEVQQGRKEIEDLAIGDEVEVADIDGQPAAGRVRNLAGPGDTLVITGKGNEEHMIRKDSILSTPMIPVQESAIKRFVNLEAWQEEAIKNNWKPKKKRDPRSGVTFWSATDLSTGRQSSHGQFTPKKSEGWLSLNEKKQSRLDKTHLGKKNKRADRVEKKKQKDIQEANLDGTDTGEELVTKVLAEYGLENLISVKSQLTDWGRKITATVDDVSTITFKMQIDQAMKQLFARQEKEVKRVIFRGNEVIVLMNDPASKGAQESIEEAGNVRGTYVVSYNNDKYAPDFIGYWEDSHYTADSSADAINKAKKDISKQEREFVWPVKAKLLKKFRAIGGVNKDQEVLVDDYEVDTSSMREAYEKALEAKWDYKKGDKGKGAGTDSPMYDGGAKNRKNRKAFRKAERAKAHAARMRGEVDEGDEGALNDRYDDETLECKHCGDYFCTSKFGGECPEIQRDMFDESWPQEETFDEMVEYWKQSLSSSIVRKGLFTQLYDAAHNDIDELNTAIEEEAYSIAETYHGSGEGIGSSDQNHFIASVARNLGIDDVFGWNKPKDPHPKDANWPHMASDEDMERDKTNRAAKYGKAIRAEDIEESADFYFSIDPQEVGANVVNSKGDIHDYYDSEEEALAVAKQLNAQYGKVDEDVARMRKLAGIKETASGGGTGAGAIASSPVAVGGVQKRNPSIYGQTKLKKKPTPKKRATKEDASAGIGRSKKK